MPKPSNGSTVTVAAPPQRPVNLLQPTQEGDGQGRTMRLWVTGAEGVLGKRVVAAAHQRGYEVRGTSHRECAIENMDQVFTAAGEFNPDAIINCAGRLPDSHPLEMIPANSLGPHVLASTKVRLVHMSTDCVFSSKQNVRHRTSETPSPDSLYGKTKAAGELLQYPHALTVRGSFISSEGGFLKWLLEARGTVPAWANAFWNGTSAVIMAEALVELAAGHRTGIIHVAAPDYITKAEMMLFFRDCLNLPFEIEMVYKPVIFRVLHPDFRLRPVREVLAAMLEKVPVGS